MTVVECKEKWRNLRTVLARHLKPAKSGSGRKKAYYLENSMQFCLPYIKTSAPPSSGNLPPIPTEDSSNELADDAQQCDSNEDFNVRVTGKSSGIFEPSKEQQPISSPPPSAVQRSSHLFSSSFQLSPDNIVDQRNQSSSSVSPYRKKDSKKSADHADKCVAKYFKAKRARLEATSASTAFGSKAERKIEAIKMFFLSIIPEVENFDDNQMKLLKRKILSIIDEISTPPQPLVSTPISTILSPGSSSTISSEVSLIPANVYRPPQESQQVESHASPIQYSGETGPQRQTMNKFYSNFRSSLNSEEYSQL